uniref:Peptidase_M14 domain-containing protein n=1 Tax=Steinernema glaseri TaxID=37863 RepID=A0A1I7XYQ8_9BILA
MEPVVGNVKPSGESLEKGQLVFDANFESGNLGRVDSLGTNEYDLFIRPDTCSPRHRVWYYFARVVFNIVNFSKDRNLFDSASASPVYKASSQTSWSRIPVKNLYYYRSAAHGNRFILSFSHLFDDSHRVEFAYCIPYTYTKLQQFLGNIESRNLSFFKRDLVCQSVQKRRLDLITIADESLNRKPKVVFVMGRVHPGETPASFVVHGLIQFLISDDTRAVKLRSLYTFKIVPMLNPDGVYLGNYRCSLMGLDLNRQWLDPSLWAQPTIYATKNLLLQYNSNPQIDLTAVIDVHAHSQRTNSFLYGNVFSKDPERCERQLIIPYLLSELTDDYSLEYTQFNTDSEKAGTNRRTMGTLLDPNCLCYTLEASFFSYRPKSNPSSKPIPYYDYKYEQLGENLALGLLQFNEVLNGERDLDIKRSFQSFLPNKKAKAEK